MSDDDADDEFSIASEDAYVAATTVACSQCLAESEVICIYCESGVASDEPLERFTVSEISAMDDALGRQFGAWPLFSIPRAPPGSIRFTRLVGRIQLNGDESFEI